MTGSVQNFLQVFSGIGGFCGSQRNKPQPGGGSGALNYFDGGPGEGGLCHIFCYQCRVEHAAEIGRLGDAEYGFCILADFLISLKVGTGQGAGSGGRLLCLFQ